MTKEQLIALGVTAEIAEKVVNGFNETHIIKTAYNELETQLKQFKGEVKDRDKQLEDLKKNSGDNEELKKQIATLQKDNSEKETQYKSEMDNFKRDSAIDLALTLNKGRNLKAIKALINIDEVKFVDGKLVGLDTQLEGLKKDSDYLFETEKTDIPNGFKPPNPQPQQTTTFTGLEGAIASSLNK